MKKALFVLVGGFPSQVIDSQVLIHCKEMKKIGINFDIISIATNSFQYNQAINRIEEVENISQCKCKVIKGIKPALPLSEFINSYILKKEISKKYEFIHARGDYCANVVSKITSKFIWDCRGDRLAEFETMYKNLRNILGKIYKRYKIHNDIKKAKKAKKAIFVSNFLKNKINYQNDYEIIGCAADEKLFYFDNDLRKKMRNKLNIKNKKVLIYSGSITYYQMFDESVEIFSKLSNEWIFLVLTKDIKKAKEKLNKVDKKSYILKSVSLKEVNSYLNAADVGIMLREENDLNKAASPTKYAEYSMSGLFVLYSNEIGDLDFYNSKINNKISLEELNNYSFDEKKRKKRARNAQILSKKSVLNKYKKIYFDE